MTTNIIGGINRVVTQPTTIGPKQKIQVKHCTFVMDKIFINI